MEEKAQTNSHKRYPLLAVLLSVLCPGLGQVYNGQLKKGLVFLGLIVGLLGVLKYTHIASTFYALAALFFVLLVIAVIQGVDGYKNARRQAIFIPKKYNNIGVYIVYYVSLVVFTNLTFFSTNNAVFLTYTVPTTGCSPTVMPGDYIAALSADEFKLGDLVTYEVENGEIYLCRIVGLPGDVLSVNRNLLTINGKKSSYTFVKNARTDRVAVAEYTEVLPNGVKHNIYIDQKPNVDTTYATIERLEVPAGHYFVMGDNRDHSLDSRYLGPVKAEDVKGIIRYIVYSKMRKKINIKTD